MTVLPVDVPFILIPGPPPHGTHPYVHVAYNKAVFLFPSCTTCWLALVHQNRTIEATTSTSVRPQSLSLLQAKPKSRFRSRAFSWPNFRTSSTFSAGAEQGDMQYIYKSGHGLVSLAFLGRPTPPPLTHTQSGAHCNLRVGSSCCVLSALWPPLTS